MNNHPVAIITGGGTGIGAATAAVLRTQGWNVLISGRRPEPLQTIADATGATPVVADAACQPDIERLVATTIDHFGRLDGVVLNAGVVRPGTVGELTDDAWDTMLSTNLSGPFRLARETLPHLIASRGSVVGVASAAALRATGGIAGYNASKAGLTMLMQSIAADYGPYGVRANAVCPGWTRTEMADMEMQDYGSDLGIDYMDAYKVATSFVPARRPANSSEVAEVIAWLLSDKASYVNSAVLPVDGGMISVDPGGLALDPRVTLSPAGQKSDASNFF